MSDERPIEGIKPEVMAAKAEAQLRLCKHCGEKRGDHINIRYAVFDDPAQPPSQADVLVCRNHTYFEAVETQ